jgi:hypothetical protein
LLGSAEEAREGVGRCRVLGIPARLGEPGLDIAVGDGGGLSAVRSGVASGAARVRVEESTGVDRTGSGYAIAGAGVGMYIRLSVLTPPHLHLHPPHPHPRLPCLRQN